MSVSNQLADARSERIVTGNGSVLRAPILLFFFSGLFWLLVAAALWILNSRSQDPCDGGYVPLLAGIIWNLGLVSGVWGVVGGGSTGMEWLEFPIYAAFPIWLAEIIMAVWAIALFIGRRKKSGYISQAFFLTAFVAFAWAYGSADGFLQISKVAGPAHTALQLWDFWSRVVSCSV